MRKTLLAFVITLCVLSTAKAQDAGQIWIGGSMGFTTSKTSDWDRVSNYKILPEIGYVISDNLGIGISLGYEHLEENFQYTVNGQQLIAKSNGFAINPFVRYSFLKGDIGSMFVDGGAGYNYYKIKYPVGTYEEEEINNLQIGFRPGVALKISDKVALIAKYGFIGYQYRKFDSDKTNTFSLDFDFRQATFGINFIF